jgi:glycerol-3-phosphate dehydrogenase (NAD(P)+)
VAGLRPLLEQLKGKPIPNIVWLCKGFEYGTGLLPHQVVREVLGDAVPGAALSGPSFAQEVARGLPCALTVASASEPLRERVVALAHGGNMRVYSCDDMVGVEVGGAVKNILAIATGTADGLGLGLNARAALITRGLAEITRLGTALGGHATHLHGPDRHGRPDPDLHRRLVAQPPRRPGAGPGQAARNHRARTGPRGRRRAVREGGARAGGQAGRGHADHQCGGGVLFDGDAAPEMVARLMARDPRNELA